MINEATVFLKALLAKCEDYRNTATITLTAIHPSGNRSTPSRHIPLNQSDRLQDALQHLLEANRLGWGAYFGVGLRCPGLGRWRRGRASDVVALPALFVDIDDADADLTMPVSVPPPSCVVHSGGGHHLYWWLEKPTTELRVCRQVLRGLARVLRGDKLSIAQSLRLPSSINTKQGRGGLCSIVSYTDTAYTLNDFCHLIPPPTPRPPRRLHHQSHDALNPDLIRRIADHFRACGYIERGDWLNGRCLYPERHRNGDANPSFGFNTRDGCGFCYRCGAILLKEICERLCIQPADYGGLFVNETPVFIANGLAQLTCLDKKVEMIR